MRKIRNFGTSGKTLSELLHTDYREREEGLMDEWHEGKAKRDSRRVVDFHFEGSLVKTQCEPWYEPHEREGKSRGVIGGFSDRSRRRMMEWASRVRRSAVPVFVTVTYPGQFAQEPSKWKRDLDSFGKRIMARFPTATVLWKLEPQERGAPHFHMMLWGVDFFPWQDCAWMWAGVIMGEELAGISPSYPVRPGKAGAFAFRGWVSREVRNKRAAEFLGACARVEKLRTYAGVKAYVSKKYMGKACELPPGWHGVGRFWGVIGRKNAPLSRVISCVESVVTVNRFNRTIRRFLASRGHRRSAYARLMTDHPLQWVRALDLARQGWCESSRGDDICCPRDNVWARVKGRS